MTCERNWRLRRSIANSMTVDQRMAIYKMAGEGHTTSEIARAYNVPIEVGGRTVRVTTIEGILNMPEAHKYVAAFRIAFLKTIKDVPISEKKVRLDDLEKLRQRLAHMANNCRVDKDHPNEISRFMSVSKRLIEVLELARNEMEQHPGLAIGIGLTQGDLSDLTDEQLRAKRDELLRKAANAINRGTSRVDEDSEGDAGTTEGEPAKVLLASPEKLPGDGLPTSDPLISDLRQQDRRNQGMPAV